MGANVAAFVAGRIDLHQCGVASFLIMFGAQAKSQSTDRDHPHQLPDLQPRRLRQSAADEFLGLLTVRTERSRHG